MKLLITGAFDWKNDEINLLKKMGNEIVFVQDENENITDLYEWTEGIICNSIFLNNPIEKFTSLKYIQLTSAGYDRVPIDYIKKNNITIHNAQGVYSIPMAEFALYSILNFLKDNKFFLNNQKNRVWEKNRHIEELNGKVACIIGCGSVGTECAKKLSALGCIVKGVNKTKFKSDYFNVVETVDNADNIILNSDIIILSLPLSKETKYFMNSSRIEKIKNNGILINLSRGGVLDTSSLCKYIKKKSLRVALDVFENEPLEDNSVLWNLENVLITPHNSFVGDGNHDRMINLIIRNMENYL